MKTVKIVLVILSFAFTYHYSYSQSSGNFQKLELSSRVLVQETPERFEETINEKINHYDKKISSGEKSPYLGALFSGIIPGTGEFYAKSYVKSAIFLAIEAGLWTAYSIFERKGDDQTNKFQNFADQNWDVYKYARWLKDQNFASSEGIDLNAQREELRRKINDCERINFSHTLPPYGDQQYYELIGKYQNFVAGWADAGSDLTRQNYATYKTDMLESYSFDRQKANDYYDNGSTALTIVIFNHVLSAADAAWSVSMFNKELKLKTSLHMENKYSYFGEKKLIPVAHINITF